MTSSGNRTNLKNRGSMKIPEDHTSKIISPNGSTSSAVASVIPRLLAWVIHPTKNSWWPSVLYPTWKDAAKDAKILHSPQTHIRIHTCTNLVSIEDLAKNRVPGKVAISRHPGIVVCYYLGLSQQQQQQHKSIVTATETAVEWNVTKIFQGYRSFYDQALQPQTQHGNITLDPDLRCALEEAYVFLGSQDSQLLRGIPTAAAAAPTTAYISDKKRSLSHHTQEQPNKRQQSKNTGDNKKIQNTPQWYHEWEEDTTQPSQCRDPSQFTQSFAINATTDNNKTTPKEIQGLPTCKNHSLDVTAFVHPTHLVDNDQETCVIHSKESMQKENEGTAVPTTAANNHLAQDNDKSINSAMTLLDNYPKSTHDNESKEHINVVQQQFYSPATMEASLYNTTSTKASEHQPITSENSVPPRHLTPVKITTHLSEKEDHNEIVTNSYTKDALHTENTTDTNAVPTDISIEESSQSYVPFKQNAPNQDSTANIPRQFSSNQDEKKSTSPLPKIQEAKDIAIVIGKETTMEQQQVWSATPEANAEQTSIEQNTSPTVTWDSKAHDRSQHDEVLIKLDTFNGADYLSDHAHDVVVPIETTVAAASDDGETNFDQGRSYPTPKSKNTHRAVTPFPLQQVPNESSSQKQKVDTDAASSLSNPHKTMNSFTSLLSPDEKIAEESLEDEDLDTDIRFFTQ